MSYASTSPPAPVPSSRRRKYGPAAPHASINPPAAAAKKSAAAIAAAVTASEQSTLDGDDDETNSSWSSSPSASSNPPPPSNRRSKTTIAATNDDTPSSFFSSSASSSSMPPLPSSSSFASPSSSSSPSSPASRSSPAIPSTLLRTNFASATIELNRKHVLLSIIGGGVIMRIGEMMIHYLGLYYALWLTLSSIIFVVCLIYQWVILQTRVITNTVTDTIATRVEVFRSEHPWLYTMLTTFGVDVESKLMATTTMMHATLGPS